MTETPLRPITNSGIWIPILAPTYSMIIISDEPWCWGFNQPRIEFPLSVGMSLARDSIVGISVPSSISLSASLFTHFVIHDPVTNSLVTMLASSLRWCITEWAQRYLSVIWSDKSQSRFMPTQQTLSEIPVVHLYDHQVTLWRFIHPKYSYGVRELYDLRVGGTCIWHCESSSNKLNDHMLC